MYSTKTRGLEIILANGTYQKIYDKWMSTYENKPFAWRNYLKYILAAVALFILLLILNWILQVQVRKKTKERVLVRNKKSFTVSRT